MTKIEYETTIEDSLAFNMFHYKNSPSIRRSITLGRYAIPVLIVILSFSTITSVVNNGFSSSNISFFIVFSIVAVSWWFFYPKYYLKIIRKNARKLYREGDNKGGIGKHELIMTPDKLIVTTEYNETKQKWSVVNKIVENKDYIFIYIASVQAHIIPKRAFKSAAEIAMFVDTAKQYSGTAIQDNEELLCDSCGQNLGENSLYCPNCEKIVE